MKADDAPPKGPAAVRRAIVDAAVRGGRISVREVARRARVNHGQVQHLFRGQAGLHRAVLEHLASRLAAALGDLEGPAVARAALAANLADRRFAHFLARYLLDHPGAPVPQEAFPVTERLLDAPPDLPPDEARVRLAAGLAAGLGWALFEPWIRAALSLTDADVGRVEAWLAEEAAA